MSIEKPSLAQDSPENPPDRDLSVELWGIARSVREVLEEVNIASDRLPKRALLQQKLEEILALIPEWTAEDENHYRADRERLAP